MAAETDNEKKTERARRRWLGRWVLKLTIWFVTLSASAILIGGLVSLVAYRNLTGLLNLAVSRFAQPYRIEFGKVDVSESGIIRLEDVSVRPPGNLANAGDDPWVTLTGVDLAFDFTELRKERRFRSIVLRAPVIRIDDASLDVLGLGGKLTSAAEGGAAAPPLDLSRLGRITDRIEVVGGRWVFETSKGPRVSGSWDVTIPPIDFGAEEWLNLEPLALRLSDLTFGPSGEWGSIDRIAVTGRVRSDLRGIEIGELAVDAPRLKVTPEWLPMAPGKAPDAGQRPISPPADEMPPTDPPVAGLFEVLIGAVTVRDAALSLSGFHGGEGIPKWPDLSLTTEIGWRGLTIEGGRVRSERPLTLELAQLRVGGGEGGDDPPLAEIERLAVGFDPEALRDRGRIESLELASPSLVLTPASLDFLLPKKEPAEVSQPEESGGEAGSAGANVAPWEIGSLKITRGELSARDWSWEGRVIPASRLGFDADLKSLSPQNLGLSDSTGGEGGDEAQTVTLRDISIEGKAGAPSSVAIRRIAVRLRLGVLLGEGRVDEFTVESPVLRLTDEVLPDWVSDWRLQAGESAGADAPPAPGVAAGGGREGPLWNFETLSIIGGEIMLDTGALGGRLPKLDGTFSLAALATEPGRDMSGLDRPFRMQLQRLRVLDRPPSAGALNSEVEGNPVGPKEKPGGPLPEREGTSPTQSSRRSIAEQDLALLRELSIDFTAAGLQRDRRIERIEVKGGEFQVGDALQRLVNGPVAPAPESADPPPPAPLQAPGTAPVPPVPAAPDPIADPQAAAADPARTSGMPTDAKGWRIGEMVITETRVRFQALIPQIEGLEFGIETKLQDIPLNEAGFLSQEKKQKIEIAGIEIRDPYDSFITVAVLPTIFVEFSLAGLVNQRIEKIDLLNPSIHVGQGLFWWIDYQRNHRKKNEGVTFAGAPAESIGVEGTGGGNDWVINEINAHFGKIVIAPTGQPIGIVPFPFSANTNLNRGEIALTLNIPKEQQYVYRFPDFELDIFGLEGDIEFNVPIRQLDNNLVQTFTLDRAVWKQHEAEELFLAVTFDTEGVYGRFGGAAYGGYAEGQFNFYLNDVGRWDAWIAGTNMDMGPITGVLTPENFLMEGKIDAKLVSQGRGLVFGETTGEIRALSPGRINVTKLDQLIAEIPESWSQLKRSATQIGMDTLKDFAYDGGSADLHFINRDGWLRFDLEGPAGSRRFEMFAHDWRGGANESVNPPGPTRVENANADVIPADVRPLPDPTRDAGMPGAGDADRALAQRQNHSTSRPNRIRR